MNQIRCFGRLELLWTLLGCFLLSAFFLIFKFNSSTIFDYQKNFNIMNTRMKIPAPIKFNSSPVPIIDLHEICTEKYYGNGWKLMAPYYHLYDAWILQNCSYATDIGKLITVIINLNGIEAAQEKLDNLVIELRKFYPSVKMLVASQTSLEVTWKNVKVLATTQKNPWLELVEKCDTKYVLLGNDMEHITKWINLHRAVRLLGMGMLVVGGAVRNGTGHWNAPCYQVGLRYYRLEIREGNVKADEDCMVCNYVGGPIVAAKNTLKRLNTKLPEEVMTLDLSLRMVGKWVTCPDIMYNTRTSVGREALLAGREALKMIAKEWQVQGVITDWRQRFREVFTCEEVGLACDTWKQSANFVMVPWCCHQEFRRFYRSMEYLAIAHGIDYAIESGSQLGAVKVGNFLPWDIDGDVDFRTDQFQHFQPGGLAYKFLAETGFKITDVRVDSDVYIPGKCNHYFVIQGNGITVDMCGRLNNNRTWLLNNVQAPKFLDKAPTKIQMGPDLWVRTYTNPGLYCRGRYGPGYLYHSESYIYKSKTSHDIIAPGPWKSCKTPGKQSCLDNYPTVGNIEIRPQIYP